MDTYSYITDKIHALKTQYPSLRERTDDYVFSVLCVKAHFYKNPALILNEDDFAEMIVDGSNDGGADILLSDPNSETCDLVIGQSKFYKTISAEQVLNAVRKMADFYNDMLAGHYERVNERVQKRFLTLNAERGEDSKVRFVFYTAAPRKKSINAVDIEKKFREQFTIFDAIELSLMFVDDVAKDIKESEDRRPTVESGKLAIDRKGNFLRYGDDAVIVNASAFSIKELYATHGTNLLALNLRYHISGGKIDKEIRETIKNTPESFWLKNNGITIICDDFRIDGTIVHLRNFSIVNGWQTTYVLSKSKNLLAAHDFSLSCKIIKTSGTTEYEKAAFSLSIAQAANSQKPIQPADLKANAPEQRSFAQAMRDVGVFYQTKRGEKIESRFDDSYLHTKLLEVGKLCLAAIFQMPCKSRSKPSSVYSPEYYEPIFNGKQAQVAAICKELLYVDDYFTKKFLKKFDLDNKDLPDATVRTTFAHIARTICIAFTALAARYHQGNITDKNVTALTTSPTSSDVYDILRNLGDMKFLLPIKLYTDAYDAILDKLFAAIVEDGITVYSFKCEQNKSLTAANFLKNDENYYLILQKRWSPLRAEIRKIFADV
ncbi:MAG: AIPR family protein [Quinella sp. 1Q7]|nr:AIPR family protein [Quinella sp. 1Q7]